MLTDTKFFLLLKMFRALKFLISVICVSTFILYYRLKLDLSGYFIEKNKMKGNRTQLASGYC